MEIKSAEPNRLFFIAALRRAVGWFVVRNLIYSETLGRMDTVDTQTDGQFNYRVMLWADSAGPAGAGPIS